MYCPYKNQCFFFENEEEKTDTFAIRMVSRQGAGRRLAWTHNSIRH